MRSPLNSTSWPRLRPIPAFLAITLLAQGSGQAASSASRSRTGGDSPWARIRNVNMLIAPEVVLEVRELEGRLLPTQKGGLAVFDDPKSFRIAIDRATTAISTASLSALLNGYTFAYAGAPLRKIEVSTQDGKLRQKGTLHKGVDVPFEMEGD